MQFSNFIQSMDEKKRPVILVEGIRALPEAERPIVVACGGNGWFDMTDGLVR